jgi:acetylornithine/N-succinyldiaminopimelate aminotransferase
MCKARRYALPKSLFPFLPENLNSVYFTNSGAEAVEGALKLAKRFTGRQQVVAFHNSYHGSTHGALSVMGNEEFKQAYRPLLPGVNFIGLNNINDLQLITDPNCMCYPGNRTRRSRYTCA